MRWTYWNDLPFRAKLVIYGGTVTLAALLVTGAVLVRLEAASYRKHFLQAMTSMADVAGHTCASSLFFDDVAYAEEALAGLDIEPSIGRACLFTLAGDVFASFERPGNSNRYPDPATLRDHQFRDDAMVLVRPVTWNDVPVGRIYVEARLDELGERMQIFAVALVVLIMVALALSLLMASALQRGLRRPIIELQETAERVSRERDYAARARQFGRDELGVLTERFNEMLARIERRDQALRESEARYRELLGRIDEVVFRLALPAGRLEFCSPGARSLFGLDPETLVDQPGLLRSLIHPDDRHRFDEMLHAAAAGQVVPFLEYRITDALGRERTIAQSNYPFRTRGGALVSLEGLFIDVTSRVAADRERNRLQSELAQAHKLEALGNLTGGIAHDFNNILGAIMGNASLALDDLPFGHPLHATLETILQASRRAAELTRQILVFSRQSRQEQTTVDLGRILDETLTLLRASLPSTISIKTRIPEAVPPVMADPTQLHQVVMNLCTNAHHAMRETGGLLELELRPVTLTAFETQALPDLKPGPHLELRVTDTGEGMPADVVERVFEPFFSTKAEGEGTGMGLAVVYGIVRDHGGHVGVTSKLGQGSSFRVLLPIVRAAAHHENEALAGNLEGRGRVLFVDDEEMITELSVRMLVRLGYEVAPFTNPWLAVEAFSRDPAAFDLVLTDYTMPNLTGIDVATRVRALRPDIPVIIHTGNRDRVDPAALGRLRGIRVATKPFDLQQLGQLLLECLQGDRPPG